MKCVVSIALRHGLFFSHCLAHKLNIYMCIFYVLFHSNFKPVLLMVLFVCTGVTNKHFFLQMEMFSLSTKMHLYIHPHTNLKIRMTCNYYFHHSGCLWPLPALAVLAQCGKDTSTMTFPCDDCYPHQRKCHQHRPRLICAVQSYTISAKEKIQQIHSLLKLRKSREKFCGQNHHLPCFLSYKKIYVFQTTPAVQWALSAA